MAVKVLFAAHPNLSFLELYNKLLQTGWLQITETDLLTAVEPRSLKSRHQQLVPFGGFERICSTPLSKCVVSLAIPGIPWLAAPLSTSVSLHMVFSVHVSVFSYKYGDGGLGFILIHYALILINYICKDPLSKYRSCSEFLGRHNFGGEDTTQPVHLTNIPQATLRIFIPPSLPKVKKYI